MATQPNTELSCRVCLSSEKQLKEENVCLYNELVCDCKGTVGAICHKCIERLILVYHERHCLHCMKIYRNIQYVYNLRCFELMSKWVDRLFGVYASLRFLVVIFIMVMKNILTSLMFYMLVRHTESLKQSRPEILAIRVNTSKGFWAEFWTKLKNKFGF